VTVRFDVVGEKDGSDMKNKEDKGVVATIWDRA